MQVGKALQNRLAWIVTEEVTEVRRALSGRGQWTRIAIERALQKLASVPLNCKKLVLLVDPLLTL
jgi:hypothetical protein